jgi:hypothetical protein
MANVRNDTSPIFSSSFENTSTSQKASVSSDFPDIHDVLNGNHSEQLSLLDHRVREMNPKKLSDQARAIENLFTEKGEVISCFDNPPKAKISESNATLLIKHMFAVLENVSDHLPKSLRDLFPSPVDLVFDAEKMRSFFHLAYFYNLSLVNGRIKEMVCPDEALSANPTKDEVMALGEKVQKVLQSKNFPQIRDAENVNLSSAGRPQDQRFTCLPRELCDLPIRKLVLTGNALLALPSQVKKMDHLVSLTVASNKLYRFPEELCELSHLQACNIAVNKIRSLSSNIRNWKEMIDLNVNCNGLNSLPEEIGEMNALQTLHIGENRLTKLPETMAKLPKLQGLYAPCNAIHHLPCLSHLVQLDLSENKIQEFPSEILQFSDLEELNLSFNLIPEVPSKVSQLSKLAVLYISKNNLHFLPTQIAELHLRKFLVYGNHIELLPKELGTISELEKLDVSENPISSIPEEIRKLKNFSNFEF